MDGNNMNNGYENESYSYDYSYDSYDYEKNNTQSGSDGLALAGMIVGIVSLVLFALGSCCTPILGGSLSIIAGIAGLVLSIIAMKKQQKRAFAVTGIICSIIGVLTGIGILVAYIFIFGFAAFAYGLEYM